MGAIAAALLLSESPSVAARWGAGSSAPGRADYFPNPVLTTHDGRRVRFYDDLLKGKTVAINTFFTSCSDVCPLSTAKMLELQRLFGDRVGRDIHFYSLSVDPIGDTPGSMRAYADRFGVGPGWTFLTGKPEDIQAITRRLGLGVVRETDPRESHSSTLMIGNEPTGRWMKHSSTDNPSFVAASAATFLGWPAEASGPVPGTQARTLKIDNGEYLFRNGCLPCHSIGHGDRIGPDLLGVHARRSEDWLRRFVRTPDQVLASGDPTALALVQRYRGVTMPNLGLSEADVEDILDYVRARSARVHTERQHAAQSTVADGAGTQPATGTRKP